MFPDDLYAERWRRMDRFEKIVWRWQKKDEFIYRDLKKADNSIRVRFEDLFGVRSYDTMLKLTRFVGLSDADSISRLSAMRDRKPDRTMCHAMPRWPEWDLRMKEAFDEIASDHMRLYYDDEPMK